MHKIQLSEPGIVRWPCMLSLSSEETDRRHSSLEPTHLPQIGARHRAVPPLVAMVCVLLDPSATVAAFRLTHMESSSLCTSVLSPQLREIDLLDCTVILPSSHCCSTSVSESPAMLGYVCPLYPGSLMSLALPAFSPRPLPEWRAGCPHHQETT